MKSKKNVKNNKKIVRKTICIYDYQARWIEENNLNLSKLIRKLLDKEMKKV